MAKVVYNRKFGGFGLSRKAQDWLRARGVENYQEIPRHDPRLVQCVETLGEQANDESAKLAVAESGSYWIDEHDGFETVRSEYGPGCYAMSTPPDYPTLTWSQRARWLYSTSVYGWIGRVHLDDGRVEVLIEHGIPGYGAPEDHVLLLAPSWPTRAKLLAELSESLRAAIIEREGAAPSNPPSYAERCLIFENWLRARGIDHYSTYPAELT